MERSGDSSILREEVQSVRDPMDLKGGVQSVGDPTDLKGGMQGVGDPTNLNEGVVLWDVIQDMVQAAARGIDFEEEGAPAIDDHMTMEGFHVSIHVDEETGFVMGGNVRVADRIHRSVGTVARGWTRWAATTMAATRTAACRPRTDRRVREG